MPSDTFPDRGVEVCTNTTSGCREMANSRGTKESLIGM